MFWALLGFVHANEVDRVIFVVGDRIVTQSDVAFEAFFDARDQSPIGVFENRSADLETLLVEIAVVRQLAGDIAVYRPTGGDVRARADAFLGSFPGPEEGLRVLADWGLDETAFLGFLYSRLVVEKYVSRDVVAESSRIGTTDSVVERYRQWVSAQIERASVRRVPR
jgi:hypothetical protein